jgi:hypothetical protein
LEEISQILNHLFGPLLLKRVSPITASGCPSVRNVFVVFVDTPLFDTGWQGSYVFGLIAFAATREIDHWNKSAFGMIRCESGCMDEASGRERDFFIAPVAECFSGFVGTVSVNI